MTLTLLLVHHTDTRTVVTLLFIQLHQNFDGGHELVDFALAHSPAPHLTGSQTAQPLTVHFVAPEHALCVRV